MGIFETIFKRPKANKQLQGFFKTLTAYTPVFTTWEGGVYESELCRAAIHAFASHVSKLQPEIKGSAKSSLDKVLKFRPNPFMSTSQFLYRVATILSVNNTAFVVPVEDAFGQLIGYYPALSTQCEVMEYGGEPWLRYHFANGQTAAIEMSRVGVLTNFQYRDDFFGSSNAALLPTMQLIHTQNEGIREGIKNSATFRFMARVNNFSKTEDLKKEQKRFTEENFSAESSGGVLLFPNTYENPQQIKSEPFIVNAAQMAAIKENVFNYFGCNGDILQNKAIGDAWSAYYEGKIEPFAVQLSLAMTNMTYSQREISSGNQIYFTANRLQYMTNRDKLDVSAQMLDRGLFNRNEIREIWNMPPIEGGDEYLIRGEYYSTKEKTEV